MDQPSQRQQAPAPSAERISAIDTLRGLALFIVLLINAATEFRVSIFEQMLPAADTSAADTVAAGIVLALHTKGIILFTFLFGVGLAIQFDRLADDGRRLALLVRRLIALLVFGLFHLFLIWNGDILTHYAIAGLMVLPLLFARRLPLPLVAALLLLWFVASPLFPPLMAFPGRDWIIRHLVDAQQVYGHGTYMEIMAFRMDEVRAILPLHPNALPRTLGLILLGAWAWRTGFFRSARLPRATIVAAWLALLAGTFLLLASRNRMPFGEWPPVWQRALILRAVSDFALAFAYGVAILAVANTPWGKRAIGWAAPVGRMAFSNYMVQSIVLGLIFYGYGFGLFGMNIWPCLAIVVAIFAAQVLFSKWWLDRFNFGPLEWLWRLLMYGRRPPFRRDDQLRS